MVDQIPDNSLDFTSMTQITHILSSRTRYKHTYQTETGGYSMGDDYNWTPVAQSVQEAFGEKHKVTGKDVWYAVKD